MINHHPSAFTNPLEIATGDAKNTAERLSEQMKSGSEHGKQSGQGVMDQAKETANKATDSMKKTMGMGGE